jgi:hypothetical protein
VIVLVWQALAKSGEGDANIKATNTTRPVHPTDLLCQSRARELLTCQLSVSCR